jgi:hypothetical protein
MIYIGNSMPSALINRIWYYFLFGIYRQIMKNAQKKGEVVVPAGGETGRPRCLAEVYLLKRIGDLREIKEQV